MAASLTRTNCISWQLLALSCSILSALFVSISDQSTVSPSPSTPGAVVSLSNVYFGRTVQMLTKQDANNLTWILTQLFWFRTTYCTKSAHIWFVQKCMKKITSEYLGIKRIRLGPLSDQIWRIHQPAVSVTTAMYLEPLFLHASTYLHQLNSSDRKTNKWLSFVTTLLLTMGISVCKQTCVSNILTPEPIFLCSHSSDVPLCD